MSTSKERTNKKWTSNPDYRDNFDKIFGKKEKVDGEETEEVQSETEKAKKEAPAK